MNIRNKLLLLLVVLTSLIGCGSDDSSEPNANVEFSFGEFGMKSFGAPFVVLHINHTGGNDIYNASCDVRAMQGSTIVDTGFAYFADGGTIKSGESAHDEAIFFNLSAHTQYETVETSECTWLYR